MKIGQKVGRGFKSLIDFRRWMGWGQIKDSAKELQGLAKVLTTSDTAQHKETFEEAAKRLKLSEEDIKRQTSWHLRRTLLFVAMTIALWVYAIYLLITQHYQGFILGVVVGVLTGSFGFREHFYYFQMKKRKLGCTLQDWINFVLRGG